MTDVDELTDEEIRAVVRTRMFQKALAYRRLADGIDLEDQGQVFESMVNSITKQHSQVRSEKSTREFFELFREEVEAFTAEIEADDDPEDVAEVLELGEEDR